MGIRADIDIGRHFSPLALSLLNRHSPGAFRAVYGAKLAATYAPTSIKDAVETVQSRGNHGSFLAALTSDDFVKVLTDLYNATGVMQLAMGRPEVFRLSHETRDIPNFLPNVRPRAGIFPALEKVLEGAEVSYGEIPEKGESYSALRYSRLLELTEQAVINDRLGLLVEPALRVGEAVSDVKATALAGLISGNPKLSDGKAVFHADHGNLAETGAALSGDTLSAAVTAMRRQKHLDGERPLDVVPRFILCPPELETAARRLVTEITPNSATDVNVFAGRLEAVVEPRLSDKSAWYLFAEPSRQLGLEHGTVEGTLDPEVRTEARMERHSVVTRVTCDFGAGWLDHRGAYKNPGASE